MRFPAAVGFAFRRGGFAAFGTLVLGLATSCGGGGGFNAPDMRLQELLFVDRGLAPTAPTGTGSLPRNAQILMVFSADVDPGSVGQDSIRIRYGPTQQSVPLGSFSVDGNTVRFDPTVTAQGEPNPMGLAPATQYTIEIPDVLHSNFTVRNVDADPMTNAYFTQFVSDTGFLRELVPPEIVNVAFQPDQDGLTQQVPGNALMIFEFNEPMNPTSFRLGGPVAPENLGKDGTVVPPSKYPSIDVRYDDTAQVNTTNGLASNLPSPYPANTPNGSPVPGRFTWSSSLREFYFHPTFSFGDKKYVFTAEVFQSLTDLAGNLLVNPRSFGPYTCDGLGRKTGKVLSERFDLPTDQDAAASDADWGLTEEGFLKGQPVTTRQAYIYGYSFVATGDHWGQYGVIPDPLVGAALQLAVPGTTPPTSQGRRVMWAFSDAEIGADGTITGAAWGPDSNATQAANYPSVILRMGYQSQDTLALSPTFSGNYEGTPTVVYNGSYQVTQAANVGNTPGYPVFTHASIQPYQVGGACGPGIPANQLQPLFDFTGWFSWPAFTTTFDWTEGDATVTDDRVLVFDASVSEGDTWEQIRGWAATTYPCSGFLIPGFPTRRMFSTYENDSPDPASTFAAPNPEPSVTDTAFTITKQTSIAQTLWYTDATQPANSTQTTFGSLSNYLPVEITPSIQSGGAQVKIEFQGCDAILADRRTINQAAPFMADFSGDLDDCDGYRCIRWRARLVSNLLNGNVARIDGIIVPVLDDF
jgi:hypothetical protein